MEQLTALIKAGIKVPRAKLEQPRVEGPGEVLRRLAREERFV